MTTTYHFVVLATSLLLVAFAVTTIVIRSVNATDSIEKQVDRIVESVNSTDDTSSQKEACTEIGVYSDDIFADMEVASARQVVDCQQRVDDKQAEMLGNSSNSY